jgi:RNA polymerase sigma-70 factor (ECF subfamily)
VVVYAARMPSPEPPTGAHELAGLLRAAAAAPLRAQLEAIDGLGARLEALYARGRAAWPAFDVSPDAWVRHLARHLAPQVARGLEVLHDDFYLAVALTLGQPAALAEFTTRFRPRLLAQLSRGNDRTVAEEALSHVEERLLVEGRIGQYSGRGSMERFIRAVGANELLNRVRGVRPEQLTDAMVESFVDGARNPELAAVSRDARRTFAHALHAAIQTLEAKERLLLRLHAVEGATIDELGRMFGVHKVTAFRWLEEARLHLRNATRRQLRETHALADRDIESLLGGSFAALDVSLRTLFASTTAAPQR